jgi:hypothetical protein
MPITYFLKKVNFYLQIYIILHLCWGGGGRVVIYAAG